MRFEERNYGTVSDIEHMQIKINNIEFQLQTSASLVSQVSVRFGNIEKQIEINQKQKKDVDKTYLNLRNQLIKDIEL